MAAWYLSGICTHTPCIFSVHLSVDGHPIGMSWPLWRVLLWAWGCGYLFWSLIYLGVCPEQIPGPMAALASLRALDSVSQWLCSLHSHTFTLVVDGRLECSHVLTVVNVLPWAQGWVCCFELGVYLLFSFWRYNIYVLFYAFMHYFYEVNFGCAGSGVARRAFPAGVCRSGPLLLGCMASHCGALWLQSEALGHSRFSSWSSCPRAQPHSWGLCANCSLGGWDSLARIRPGVPRLAGAPLTPPSLPFSYPPLLHLLSHWPGFLLPLLFLFFFPCSSLLHLLLSASNSASCLPSSVEITTGQ